MGERDKAWMDAAEYAANVAGVDELAARDRGVPVERIRRMEGCFEVLRAGDPDAFYVMCCRESSRGGTLSRTSSASEPTPSARRRCS